MTWEGVLCSVIMLFERREKLMTVMKTCSANILESVKSGKKMRRTLGVRIQARPSSTIIIMKIHQCLHLPYHASLVLVHRESRENQATVKSQQLVVWFFQAKIGRT